MMASVDAQQTWVPYEPTKDCSQGFCSIYCPQWCYIVFPPPPPLNFSDDSSAPAFSPLVIAIIGILASAFLLVSYYTIVSKYCGNFESFRRRSDAAGDDSGAGAGGQVDHHDAWHVTGSEGLDEAVIRSIAVLKYKKGDGFTTDCSVCLAEFREDESLRLLPKCSHAFHLQCIDTWLKSHSNCPLCRANVVSPVTPSEPPEPTCNANDTSLGVAEQERSDEEEISVDPKDLRRVDCELGRVRGGDAIIEIRDDNTRPTRWSVSADRRGRVLISDVLEMGTEDEYSLATDDGPMATVSNEAGTSSRVNLQG